MICMSRIIAYQQPAIEQTQHLTSSRFLFWNGLPDRRAQHQQERTVITINHAWVVQVGSPHLQRLLHGYTRRASKNPRKIKHV